MSGRYHSAASLTDVLKALLPFESFNQCLQDKLHKLDREGAEAHLEHLMDVIVEEVMDTVNVIIAKAVNVSHGPMETTGHELVQNVTSLLKAQIISATGTFLTVKEYKLDSALASATGEAMNAVLCAAETCFDGNKKLKSLLASMKKAIRVLTGNRISTEDTLMYQTEEPEEVYVCDEESDIAEKFSNNGFRATVTEEVTLKLVECFTGLVMSENPQEYSPASDLASAASSAVEMVLEGLQSLVSSTPAQDSLTKDQKVWSTTREVFSHLLLQLKHFFTALLSRQRHAELFAFSREVVSHVLVHIQSGLANSSDIIFDDEDQIIEDIIVSLIESVGRVTNEAGQEQQRLDSAVSIVSQGGWSNWSEETLHKVTFPVLPEITTKSSKVVDALQGENLDFNVLPQDEASCIPHETVVSAVNRITEMFGLQSEESSTLHCQGNLTSVLKRLEKSLSQGTIQPSHELTEEIYQLLLKGRQTVAARKSASAMAGMKKAHGAPEGVTATKILDMLAQESIRSLFLPCFQLSSSWKTDLKQPSLSCPGGLNSGTSKSPSQILSEVLQASMEVMAKDVMNILSLTLCSSENFETFMKTSFIPDFKECEEIQEDATDYSSLVAVIIRLLTKLHNEEKLSDDMLDNCRALIDKVLPELVTPGGVTKTDYYLAGTNIRKVLRVIYNDLLTEFGSKNRLLKALESMDHSVEVTVMKSLISEIMAHVTDDEVTKPKNAKKRRGFFRCLPSMSKITSCLKVKSTFILGYNSFIPRVTHLDY